MMASVATSTTSGRPWPWPWGRRFLLLAVLLAVVASVQGSREGSWRTDASRRRRGAQQRDLSGLVGETVMLPCHVDTASCGTVHSVKWYRGSSRIYVFSEMAVVDHAEGDYVDRADLHYKANATMMHLSVKNLAVVDEATYKCEITYNEVKDGCSVVQFINLTTMIKPEYVKITREGNELQNATLIGPFSEGDDLALTCESGGGKPTPTVAWYNGTAKLSGDYTTEPGSNGAGTGRNSVRLALTRGDLGAKYECRATNDALELPMVASVEVDVNVRPLALELTGVDQHVVQGSSVTLQCVVSGARPSATVTWYNGTEPLDANRVDIKDSKSLQSDGTHDTVSELVFTATRYENGESLTCEATNEVLLLHSEPPMRKTVALEVMYPPIVSVTPDNVTVNESTDILLFCQYEANPATLRSVKWRRDGEVVLLDRKDHYEGGTPDQTTLLIKNSTRHDHGMYTCELENGVGKGNSSNGVYVNIQFRPVVKLEMDPPTPVSELSKMNITLICRVEAGNPDTLTEVHWYKDGELVDPDETLQAVRWLLDGELLKELPDCNSTAMGDSFCDVDPSKLLLEAVERSFHGNYSCEGANEAGWGPVSDDTPLIVYYPPGPAELTHDVTVVKNSAITLSCAVSDLGRPPTTSFRWLRNSSPVNNVTSANWTINPVTLRTRSNFTCLAVNEGGEGESATAEINVLAPPSFIERLNPYEGAPFNATHINISCQVECQPLCDVNWLKNGQPVELSRGADMAMYSVRNVVVDPDYNRGDFDSIRSTLIWNMAAWPNGQLDRVHDNANYTCQSSGNPVGNGVKSTTIFGVEYPPENITVSKQVVSVVESRVPELVLCSARAYPEASYEWRAENSTDETSVVKRNKLILNKSMHRKDSGNWTCTAINRHGSISTTIRIDVQYKPECTIASEEVEGQLVLTCMVRANPDQVSFTWRIENSNETVEENVVSQGLRSRLTLDTRAEDTRTYLCYATNAVGTSFPCERGVQGNLSWWKRLENDNLMIIIAVVVSTIIMVLIICIIIILVCRRKRAADKCPNPAISKDKAKDRNNAAGDALLGSMLPADGDGKAFYENLPFHGIQNAPNKTLHLSQSHLQHPLYQLSSGPALGSPLGLGHHGLGHHGVGHGLHAALGETTLVSRPHAYGHSATLQRPPSRHKQASANNLHHQQRLSSCASLPRRQASVPAIARGLSGLGGLGGPSPSLAPSIPPLPYSPPSYGGLVDNSSAIYSDIISASARRGGPSGGGGGGGGGVAGVSSSRRNYANSLHHGHKADRDRERTAPPSYSERADLDLDLDLELDHAVLKFHDVGQEIDV